MGLGFFNNQIWRNKKKTKKKTFFFFTWPCTEKKYGSIFPQLLNNLDFQKKKLIFSHLYDNFFLTQHKIPSPLIIFFIMLRQLHIQRLHSEHIIIWQMDTWYVCCLVSTMDLQRGRYSKIHFGSLSYISIFFTHKTLSQKS